MDSDYSNFYILLSISPKFRRDTTATARVVTPVAPGNTYQKRAFAAVMQLKTFGQRLIMIIKIDFFDQKNISLVAEVGSLSARAKLATKLSSGAYLLFFATNASYFVRNCKVANSFQYDMQYTPCNRALLAQ